MYVQVNGNRLFFDVTGPGIRPLGGRAVQVPTLLILHGGPGMDHMGVKAELLPLAEHFQLVWIDHRGNGRSDGSDRADWNLPQWADDVKAFCDVLGIVKPIVLGQSFGGVVAQAYAYRHPEHPSKVIFSSICARWNRDLAIERFGELGGPAIREAASNFWSRMNADDMAAYHASCYSVYNPTPGDSMQRELAIRKEEVTHHFLQPGGPFQTIDQRPDLARVIAPTLVLAGTLDPVIPWELSRELADAVVNAPVRYVQMDGCGHGVWRDKPEEARQVLLDFMLERV